MLMSLFVGGSKFNSGDFNSYPAYGYADQRYKKGNIREDWRRDEYLDAYDVLNDYYEFKPYTLKFIRLQFGQFFHWENRENRNIERPAHPTI